MYKRILIWLLTAAMAVGLLSGTVSATGSLGEGSCGENLTWVLAEDGTLSVSGEGAMDSFSTNDVPWLALRTRITALEIGEGVTGIGNYAFYGCAGLSRVQLPETLGSIGTGSFDGCAALTEICLPEGLKTLGANAFQNCAALETVLLPAAVEQMGTNCFHGCTSLDGIWVSGESRRFANDSRGVLFNRGMTALVEAPDSLSGAYVIPEGVEQIGLYAFKGCTRVTSFQIPASVKLIDFCALSGCMAELTFLGDAPEIDDAAFLSGYFYIYYPTDNPTWNQYTMLSYGGNVIWHEEETDEPTPVELFRYTVWEDHVEITGYNGTEDDVRVPAVIEGLPVTVIGTSAFYDCDVLKTVELPEGIESIGYSAFAEAGNLRSIVLPEGVRLVDGHAFRNCARLKSVTFPLSLKEVGWYAFDGCAGLTEVRYAGSLQQWKSVLIRDYNDPLHNARIYYHLVNPFHDVAQSDFYYAPVVWALENGITNGVTDTTFNPGGTCLRAQVVTFLHRAEHNPLPESDHNPFTDVKETDFFYGPVLWAVRKGITNGTSATTFGSYDNCNRAAVVTFLWRAAGCPEPKTTRNPFKDVKSTDFFYKAVLWAVENGITNGVDATHFGPTQTCNRAQVVTFLYRAYS